MGGSATPPSFFFFFFFFCHSCKLEKCQARRDFFPPTLRPASSLFFFFLRWQLLSRHKDAGLLSVILAPQEGRWGDGSGGADVAATRGGLSAALCGPFVIGKDDTEWKDQRRSNFSPAEGKILRSSELHFFLPPLQHSLYMKSGLKHFHYVWTAAPITATGAILNTDFHPLSWSIHAVVLCRWGVGAPSQNKSLLSIIFFFLRNNRWCQKPPRPKQWQKVGKENHMRPKTSWLWNNTLRKMSPEKKINKESNFKTFHNLFLFVHHFSKYVLALNFYELSQMFYNTLPKNGPCQN